MLSFVSFWPSPHLLCLAPTSVPKSSSLVDMEVEKGVDSKSGMEPLYVVCLLSSHVLQASSLAPPRSAGE